MAKAVDLLSYWMPVLRSIRVFQEIARAEEQEITLLLSVIDKTLDNMFISTADEDGVARFEKIMGIIPADGEDLEVRRFRLQTKWHDQLPYTEAELHNRLKSLCGDGGYTLDISYNDYYLSVGVGLRSKENLTLVKELLANIVPCNLIVEAKLLYNTYDWLKEVTHDTLSASTHEQVKETPWD